MVGEMGHPESDRRVQGAGKRQGLVRSGLALMAVLAVYGLSAYLIMPTLWSISRLM